MEEDGVWTPVEYQSVVSPDLEKRSSL